VADELKQIAAHLTVMMGSAKPHIEGGDVTGYTIKTGALHRIIGLLAGAGHPVTVPAVRWCGAPCHGMGGAHECGDHRCTAEFCAAFGVPEAQTDWSKVPPDQWPSKCPKCGAGLSYTSYEPYCAYEDCRWNNAPAGVLGLDGQTFPQKTPPGEQPR
jgi:hypothetical protein